MGEILKNKGFVGLETIHAQSQEIHGISTSRGWVESLDLNFTGCPSQLGIAIGDVPSSAPNFPEPGWDVTEQPRLLQSPRFFGKAGEGRPGGLRFRGILMEYSCGDGVSSPPALASHRERRKGPAGSHRALVGSPSLLHPLWDPSPGMDVPP